MPELTGYTDFDRGPDGRVMATAHYADGSSERREVRVVIERQITRADGAVEAAGVVASTDDGSVSVGAGVRL